MPFIADLHIHSPYSRATSKNLRLESLHYWSRLKGITVCGTGDCTHPQWLDHIAERLEQDTEGGLYRLKPSYARHLEAGPCQHTDIPVRFMLTGEISTIYKYGGKTRKTHSVVCMPDIETAQAFQRALERVGNIRSDGRPILGLDARDLLEIVLECSSDAFLIPAHIWTPWFSVLGSKSGFDSIEECYRDLAPHIRAVETGLSSDPPMNWMVSSLDKYVLVSNSDAHSAIKLGREANLFECPLSYRAMIDAMQQGGEHGFRGTLEFFPQEGKYHLDGHRKCNIRFSPEESKVHQGICPVCGGKLTLGVMYRVHELADRPHGAKPANALPYYSLLSLDTILSQLLGKGPATKTVHKAYNDLLARCGPELSILMDLPLEEITRAHSSLLAEAIRRVRCAQVQTQPGYDGVFGTIEAISAQERMNKGAQASLFSTDSMPQRCAGPRTPSSRPPGPRRGAASERPVTSPQDDTQRAPVLNAEQQRVCTYAGGSQVVVAGPGTGKTRTLLHRIAHLIDVKGVKPTSILALTFSNRAAQEIRDRITTLCPHMPPENAPTVTTFHKLGYGLIREHFSRLGFPAAPAVMSEDERKRRLLFEAAKRSGDDIRTNDIELSAIARIAAGEPMVHPAQFLAAIDTREASAARRRYQDALVDFCDLLLFPLFLFSEDDAIRTHYRAQWPCIFVDEYQDINALQYRLITLLCDASHEICAIGDPDQAIYGFRGADPSYFLRFQSDFPASRHTVLQKNYRCSETICAAAAGVIAPIRAHDTPQYSMAPNGPHVRITGLATEAAEAEHIVCRIEELIGGSSFFARDSDRSRHEGDETIGLNDIAILTRTHAVADPIEHALRRSSIPCQRVRKSSLIGDKGLQAALALLRMVTAAHSRMHAMHLFSFSLPGLSGKIRTLLSTYLHTADDSDQPILTRLKSQDGLSHTARRGLAALEESGEHIAYACASGNMRSALETAARATGTSDDRLRERPWDFFLRYAQGFDTIDDFISTIALDIDNDFFDPRAQGVTLTTLHAAKGCEWPVVFVAGCEDGLLPLRDFGREADHDEERRLLYVGMTRAQSTLECTYARVRSRRGTSRSSRRLSPFLENLSPRQVTHACIESPKKHRGIRTEQLDLFSQ